jgi:putative ABC transport system permease protein
MPGAIRSLLSTPAVSLVIVMTLALGIGANTAIFSVVNSLLLRPLPVPAPGRLITISSDYALGHGFKAGVGWNYAMWTRLQQLPPLFDGVLAWTQPTFNLAASGEQQPARALLVSGDFFRTLGVLPRMGRLITMEDDVRGGGKDGAVVVVSYRFWQERLNGSTDALGSKLSIDGVPFTIIGVTPREFLGVEVGQAFDIAIPLGADPLIRGARTLLDQKSNYSLVLLVRLKPDQSIDAATAALRSIQPQVLGVAPKRMVDVSPAFLKEPFVAVPAPTGTSDFSRLRRQYQQPLVTLLVLVGVVLLIACVNVASVLLARATGRRFEFGVRLALGATRRQLVSQLLVESLLLSAAGAMVGLLLAWWISRALVAQLSGLDSHLVFNLEPDWRVLVYTALTSLVTAILFGTAPAIRATGAPPAVALRGAGGARSMSEGGARLTSGLIVLQIALSLMLVVAAGLLIRTFGHLLRVPLGFDSSRVLIVLVDTARAQVDAGARLPYFQRVADAVASVPGVARAAASMHIPLSAANQSAVLAQADRVESVVGPGYFRVYGTPLVAGRDFGPEDAASAPPVAIVNQAYARKFFPDRNALGEIADKRTIVGISGDAVFATIRGGVRPTSYVPLAQSAGMGPPGRTATYVSVRADAGSPSRLTRDLSTALATIDPELSFSFRPLQEYVDASVSQERVVATLAGLFGGLALLLAGLGLYGVTAYAVSRRRFELGIRLALGAQRLDVLRLILFRTLAITGAGVVLGLMGAFFTARYLETLLFGIVPLDPLTFVAVAAMLIAVAFGAAFFPARRATRIDPVVALRAE